MRRELPLRRENETVKFQVDALTYHGTVSRFADGTPAEVFLNTTKLNNASDTNARDAAIAASLALQFGCPFETLRHALTRNPDNSAAGPLGKFLDLIERKA